MANGKTKQKNYKNVEIPRPKTTWSEILGGPLWVEKKNKSSGEYTGSTPAFSATHHPAQREVRVCMVITYMYVCMYVCMVITYSRVWINRVRLPILLVVS